MNTLKIGLVLAAIVLFSACAGSAPAVPPRTAETKPAAAPAGPVKAEWESKWDRALAGARAEGKVMLYSQTSGTLRADMVKAFKEKHGIDLEITSGRGEELIAKAEAERRAGLYLADVLVQGAGPDFEFRDRGFLDPIEPALILPEVIDPKAWMGGGLHYADKERKKMIYFFLHAGSTIIINTNLVKPEEIRSYRDLLDPRWKGKIVMDNPTVTGAGGAFFALSIMELMGIEFANGLVKQEVRIIGDQRQLVEWVARGSYPIGLAPRPQVYQEFRAAGAPLKFIIPAEGTYATGGFGAVSLINRAPHPNAAVVFINWLLTKEGQTVMVKGAGDQSRRIDVTTEYIDEDRRIKPGVNYLDQDNEDIIMKKLERQKQAREIFAPLLR
ncbi:MAG: extracellular solute-binding protein [Chloroflexi bacterium]|nr:extracellular solute-binding protein [Chloroflexota bacterium]